MSTETRKMPPNAGKGRPRGSKNKFTTLKAAFLQTFEDLGGTEELTRWARMPGNRESFYKMVTKLLPKTVDVGAQEDNPLEVKMTWFPPSPRRYRNGKIR